jgi:hypothetical protein
VTHSVVIENLLDYARSEARRYASKLITGIHLVAGLRCWREEQFDRHFPSIASSLHNALILTRGDSIDTPALDPTLVERLGVVRDMDGLWELSRELLAELELTTPEASANGLGERTVLEKHPIGSNQEPKTVTTTTSHDSAGLSIGALEGLADRLAKALARPAPQILENLLSDAAWIHTYVTGDIGASSFVSALCALRGDDAKVLVPNDLSDLVAVVDREAGIDAKKLASEVAFAYADLAEWSAALDENFENAEVDRIDIVKERLLGLLGGSVDPEVGATQRFEELFASLVGMKSVKSQIRKFVDLMVIQRRRERRGLKVAPQRMHMVFLGNPGTGKTTVARLYGQLLFDLGLMKTKKFVEVAGTDFTGTKYIGEAEPIMKGRIQEALDGVLFIDEAYSMNDPYNEDNKKGPGLKATDVLVKMMEDHRDRLCVILAGYTDLTKQYLQANPGMPSRIGAYIEFPDYNTDEIRQMVPIVASRRDLILGDGCCDRISEAVEVARCHSDFGNARSIERVIEEAERNCVSRMAALGKLATDRRLRTILAEDVPHVAPPYRKLIGFTTQRG